MDCCGVWVVDGFCVCCDFGWDVVCGYLCVCVLVVVVVWVGGWWKKVVCWEIGVLFFVYMVSRVVIRCLWLVCGLLVGCVSSFLCLFCSWICSGLVLRSCRSLGVVVLFLWVFFCIVWLIWNVVCLFWGCGCGLWLLFCFCWGCCWVWVWCGFLLICVVWCVSVFLGCFVLCCGSGLGGCSWIWVGNWDVVVVFW